MQIVAALFIDEIEMRQVPGPATRIDLRGIQFSAPAPGPFPVTITPHLVVLIRCAPGDSGSGVLEVVFDRDGEEVARNVAPITVEPGKFTRQLVQAELTFDEPGTIEARCRIDLGEAIAVPYTLLDPVPE